MAIRNSAWLNTDQLDADYNRIVVLSIAGSLKSGCCGGLEGLLYSAEHVFVLSEVPLDLSAFLWIERCLELALRTPDELLELRLQDLGCF